MKKEVDLEKLAQLLNIELIDFKNEIEKINDSTVNPPSDVEIVYRQ